MRWQMFEVARSRRICCSRVWRAMRYATAPWTSRDTPIKRPGICRTKALRVAKNAACGPPNPIGTPKRWELPTTTSAPASPGRCQHSEREQVGGDSHHRSGIVRVSSDLIEGPNTAVRVGILQQDTKRPLVEGELVMRRHDDLDVKWLGATADNLDSLGPTRVADQEAIGAPRASGANPVHHRHRFGCGGGLIEERRVCDLHTGQVFHHGLKDQQRLEASLRNLWLVGRIGRVPTGVFEDVTKNDAWGDGSVVTQTDEGAKARVLRGG